MGKRKRRRKRKKKNKKKALNRFQLVNTRTPDL